MDTATNTDTPTKEFVARLMDAADSIALNGVWPTYPRPVLIALLSEAAMRIDVMRRYINDINTPPSLVDHHPIPKMVERGIHWSQPMREAIDINDDFAAMSIDNFQMLGDYTGNGAPAKAIGRMWKVRVGEQWHLRWYEPSRNDALVIGTNSRAIRLNL